MRHLSFSTKLENNKITPQLSFFNYFQVDISKMKSIGIYDIEQWFGDFEEATKISMEPQTFSKKQELFILKVIDTLEKEESLSLFKVKNKKDPIGQVLSKIPTDKKYRKLFFESFQNLYLLIKVSPYWVNGLNLISLGVNKDLVYNEIVKKIGFIKDKDLSSLGSIRELRVSGFLQNANLFNKSKLKFLISKYSHERVISLVFNDSLGKVNFIEDVIREIKDSRISKSDLVKLLPKKPKNIDEIHDFFFDQLALIKIEKEPDFPLNPREDFLKMDGKEIEIDNEKLKVHVPKTRKELGIYSAKHMFDNCVGTSDHYAQGVKNGNWTIIGVFDQLNKPRYCLQVQKYSFLQAKGVRNSEIDKKVLVKLESLLTIKPELPSQFIPVDHSFIFGYCYNPEKESLFIMFRKNESIYENFGVSQDVYETFQKEKSKGRFLNSVLKKLSNERAS